jgi:pyrroloquinoline quinone (PQQ) biosynthesis protein C
MIRSGAALRLKLAQTEPALRAATNQLWRSADLSRRYPKYLTTMHGVIRASVPLMELAARRCAERGAGDATADPVRRYLERHIVEERGHDTWLLEDLRAMGADPARPVAELPSPAVARLVGAQYYWVEHHHPVTLLGYIAVMESNAPTAPLANWIRSNAGVPDAAVRTVREHADLDTGHSSAVFDLLDRLALNPAQERAVAVSGVHTASALLDLLAGLGRPSRTPSARWPIDERK